MGVSERKKRVWLFEPTRDTFSSTQAVREKARKKERTRRAPSHPFAQIRLTLYLFLQVIHNRATVPGSAKHNASSIIYYSSRLDQGSTA